MLSTAGKVVIVEGGVSETNEGGGWVDGGVIQGIKGWVLVNCLAYCNKEFVCDKLFKIALAKTGYFVTFIK